MKTTINTIHNSKKNANFSLKKRPFQAKSGGNDPIVSDVFKEETKTLTHLFMQYICSTFNQKFTILSNNILNSFNL